MALRPASFIYTLMGDLMRHRGGEIWIGSLTRLMAEFGLSEAAVRQAVSRMTRQGWLEARKVGNRAYYRMSARGSARVERVSPRIYREPDAAWDGRWRMVAYSVPEALRERRDRFRKDLTVVGFAPLGPSLWLSPGDVLDAARESAAQCGVIDHADFFVAESRGPRSDRDLIARCWDLERIASAYRSFIAAYAPPLERSVAQAPADAAAFAERERLVHEYRKFIYLDPGLPRALLPRDWPAPRASALFRASYDRLTPGALRFFDAIFSPAPDALAAAAAS